MRAACLSDSCDGDRGSSCAVCDKVLVGQCIWHIVEDAAEKHHGLLALVRKYAAQYEEEGVKYIAAASHRVHVLKLQIAVMTGKARKK